jgi:hypothetical protein
MVNLKKLKSLAVLAVGGTGAIAQTVAPALAGSYDGSDVGSIVLTAVFIVLTVIGIKEVNKSYSEDEL